MIGNTRISFLTMGTSISPIPTVNDLLGLDYGYQYISYTYCE